MTPTHSPVYRADIDGLRAIAVLAVIAFHASANLLPGGFVGVDIFFVISGYLITGLIAKAIENGDFRFTDFYTRRIKRIFPAYIVVALATLLASSYLLIPNDYIFYTTSLAASWAFASNIFFSMLSWGYFGQRTEEFPLLHTWSLSVEEQFYFIFPVVLLFLFRHFRKHVVLVLFAMGILFTCISEWKTGQVKSYFLLTSRAHELIIGALTYFISQRFPVKSQRTSTLLALPGMTLMLGSLWMIDRGSAFPGVNSLYPCLGTALIIYAGQARNALSPLLANRLMVSIGLISYSLYLWHWPIFTFLRYRKIELTPGVGLAAVALSFLLAFLTWKVVERPIRQNPKIGFKKAFLQIYLAPAMFFMSVGLYSYVTEGAPMRFSDDLRELISSYSYERDLTRSCSIRAEDYRKVTAEYLSERCAFGDLTQPTAQVLLMGDSHADHFKQFVGELAKNARLKAVYHVQGTCRPTSLRETAKNSHEEASTCEKRNADLLELAGKFQYVVLAGFWSDYPAADLENELRFAVEKIIRAGATPVVFKDNANHEPDLSQCILHKKRGWIAADRNCNIPYTVMASVQEPVDRIIDKVKSEYPDILVVDPKQIMCTSAECMTHMANVALYKDSNHINSKASKLLGEQYISHVGNPLEPVHYARNSGAQ